jgi:hypothetical protein
LALRRVDRSAAFGGTNEGQQCPVSRGKQTSLSAGFKAAFDPEAEALFEGQKVNWPIETFRRSRFHDSLRDEEQFEGIRGIRHGYYY